MLTRRHFLTLSTLTAAGLALSGLPAFAQSVSGQFRGASRHTTTGGVTIALKGGQSVVVLADDFSLDSGPDPVVGLGRDGTYDPATFSGELAELSGAQEYVLPAGVDPSGYNEVYIWCRAAGVPLGVASLN